MTGYVELRCKSAFSFLHAASDPEDLAQQAALCDLPAMALTDVDGVYGAPRFYKAACQLGIRPLVGADLSLAAQPGRLLLLVKNPQGYKNLCRLITLGHRRQPKGQSAITLEQVGQHAQGLLCLTGDALDRALEHGNANSMLHQLKSIFGTRNLWVELGRHYERPEARRNQALVQLARQAGLPLVATNDVRYAKQNQRRLQDVFCCLRHKVRLDKAGRRLFINAERYIKTASQMQKLFCDLPQAVHNTLRVAERLQFSLQDLGYRFPEFPLPPGETAFSFLHRLVHEGARWRYRPLEPKHMEQLTRELSMITKLDLAGYFLVVWDITRFCREQGILVQGRGSAANSAVCYALGITAVDPIKMGMLFERFLSEERGSWPDIDLDLPSGDQREKVIQYVYQRYGRHAAAMTANVITYRQRSAVRELGKVLGLDHDRLARAVALSRGHTQPPPSAEQASAFSQSLRTAGLDPDDKRVALLIELSGEMQHLPRHLGQHSGGMVIAASSLEEVVPLEPASMPGRTVVQWDKDDCAEMGIIKVDLLGLGMLKALEQAVYLIRSTEGSQIDLAHLPQNDPKVYRMLQQADTVGVFQVESRAQMATLPRLKPRCYYDLVIEVALIRPGPIVGKMVHPYLNRRAGREEVSYPHPSLKPILERTLGVPLFQEQIMRIAMVAAGFSAGQAEELRRAMTHKRSTERMATMAQLLREGMSQRGISNKAAEQIVESIASFALYGFPESHAASFALIVYASAYIKAHHPAAFYCALLNAWPMGFYHPATLVKDAQRHQLTIRPIDVTRSSYECTIESDNTVRLGLRFVAGLRHAAAKQLAKQQANKPFCDLKDLQLRCQLHENELASLAQIGAFGGLGLKRRQALWQAYALETKGRGLLARLPLPNQDSPLKEMTAPQCTSADLDHCGMTTGPHPLTHLRAQLKKHNVLPAAVLGKQPDGIFARVAGLVIMRQRPGTAKGMCFLTLEDETGLANIVISPDVFAQYRAQIIGSGGVIVSGQLQRREGVTNLRAQHIAQLDPKGPTIPARNFH